MNEGFEYEKFNKDPDYEPSYYNLNDNSTKNYDTIQYSQTPYDYYENEESNLNQTNSFMNSKTSSNYFHYYNNNKDNYNYPKPYDISFPMARRSLKHSNNETHPLKNKINMKFQDSIPLITDSCDKENYDPISSQYEIKNLVQVYDASNEEKNNIFDIKNMDNTKKIPPKYYRKNVIFSVFDENKFRKNSIKKLNTDLLNVNKSKINAENQNKKKSCNDLLKSKREKKREISDKKEHNATTTNATTNIDLGDKTTVRCNGKSKNKMDKKISKTFEIENDNNTKSNGSNSCNNLNEKSTKKIETLSSKNNSVNTKPDTPKFKQILIKGKNQNKTKNSIIFIDNSKKHKEKEKSIISIRKNTSNQELEESSENSESESEEESDEKIIIEPEKNKSIITEKKYKKNNKNITQNQKEKKEKQKEEKKEECGIKEDVNGEIEEKSIIKNEEDKKNNINENNKYELLKDQNKNLDIKNEEEVEIKEIELDKLKNKIQVINIEKKSNNIGESLLPLTHKKISSFSNKNLPNKQHSNNISSNERSRNDKQKIQLNRSILFSNSEKKIEYPLLFRDIKKRIDDPKYNNENALNDYSILKSISNPNCVSVIENKENYKNNENKEIANKINYKKNINIVSLRDNHNLVTIKSTRSKQMSNNSCIVIMNSNSKVLSNSNNNINEKTKTESLFKDNNHIIHNSYGNYKGRGMNPNNDINKKRVISVKTENNENSSKNKLKNHCVKVTYGSSMNKNNNTFIKDSDFKKNIPTPAKSNHSLYVSGYTKKLTK